jgi:hypothetical protein
MTLFLIVDNGAEDRPLAAWLFPFDPHDPNVSIVAARPDQSEVIGKTEVLCQQTERWISSEENQRPIVIYADTELDTNAGPEVSLRPSLPLTRWEMWDKITENKTVLMLLGSVLAALAAWLGGRWLQVVGDRWSRSSTTS